eukprot:CAMPEP_0195532970 /NCGR_PEP_ID=MMETSP0794_2-20130614/39516_1 /TAXON_ID=515487 /ORGANISM="Stephanopyxis turris, Strain CCMP 815" /LENGTH=916 /DNA_ID=CAMNT_0040665359 /DNA_START=86 /DNA_END=2839 /DNA_ORIENTATION=+
MATDIDEIIRQNILNTTQLWSNLNLPSLIESNLSDTVKQSKIQQEQSKAKRKHLADLTRQFKKTVKHAESTGTSAGCGMEVLGSIESCANMGKNTIKAYQEGMDQLTKRCKHSETAVSALHAALSDAPDPVGVLRGALERLEYLTEEMVKREENAMRAEEEKEEWKRMAEEFRSKTVAAERKAESAGLSKKEKEELVELRQEVSEYEEEFKGLKNQDITIRKLEGAILDLEHENEALKESNKELQRAAVDAISKVNAATASPDGVDAVEEAPTTVNEKALSNNEREEILQLRREVAEYEAEFKGLKNQDITIRNLESKITDMQQRQEDEVMTKMQAFQQQVTAAEGRRVSEALEREARMERRVQSLELELRAEKAGRVANLEGLLEKEEGLSEREAAWEAQRTILVDDAERSREDLYEVTRERDQLRLQLAAVTNTHDNGDTSGIAQNGAVSNLSTHEMDETALNQLGDRMAERKAFEAEVRELVNTNTTLREELKSMEKSVQNERNTHTADMHELTQDRDSLATMVENLEKQIEDMPSQIEIENMKRELRVLKRLEYNDGDGADDNDDAEELGKDPERTTPGDNQSDLETILVSRLRKIESNLLRERRERGELDEQYNNLQKHVSALERKENEQDTLILSLEADLQKAIGSPPPKPIPKPKQTISAQSTTDSNTLQMILDSTDTDAIPDHRQPTTTTPHEPPQSPSKLDEKANDDHSVVTIVMAQRDRLRARCDALEAERDSFKRELQVQVRSAESLKSDNTKLYEKVRYLQNFATNNPTSNYNNQRKDANDRDLDLEALEERYEASVDPFRQFSRQERQRKLKEMSPTERIVFMTAKMVLANKQMRTGLFFYVMGLHLLVFITTYHWSHEMACTTDSLSEHPDLAHLHHGVPILENAHGVDWEGGGGGDAVNGT